MYRVLYRKWRPKVFSDVIGQPQVTTTIASQVKENRLSHAYLFTGSRGTGKTTCAKIFSKAVNCLNPVNGDPCNECEICKGIDAGSVLDIVEIDAASNRGIEDIRILRDEVNFTPSQAKYRVYIIDEVHMLTIEAFNALLKTLEEPPEHVKFILATTEVHKLPATILSRCQRFDFRRIEPQFIAERLKYVAREEGAELSHDAAMLIARIADGGMRDALSLLDRCISVSDSVTVDTVSASAGLMGREHIYSLVRAVADGDTARCLMILDELHKGSCDTERLVTELIDRFRGFLIVKTVKNPENLLVCTDEELGEIKEIASLFTKETVLYALNVLTTAADAMRKTQNRRIEAEMALIRLTRPETDESVSALSVRISQLEKEIELLKRNGVRAAEHNPVKTGGETPPLREEIPFDDVPPFEEAGGETPPLREDLPFEESDGFDEAPPFDDVPPFDDAPPFDDVPPPFEEAGGETPPLREDMPFGNAPKTNLGEFRGFGEEGASKMFDFSDDGDDADDSFDFDAFMKQHEGNHKKAEPEIQPAAPEEPDLNKYDELFEDTLPEDVGGDKIDNRTWGKIVLETEKLFPPLIGQLTGSSARIEGGTIYIKLGEKNLKVFVKEEILGNFVTKAAGTVLGKTYRIKID
ncbi:MAG: DNA polymerase III subunit gamma/tau [Clostridia bacterium]|nr:DNA polymerase III subunit gamma/tau [Clostridia bacterium]